MSAARCGQALRWPLTVLEGALVTLGITTWLAGITEPASLVLLALGLLGAAATHRRWSSRS